MQLYLSKHSWAELCFAGHQALYICFADLEPVNLQGTLTRVPQRIEMAPLMKQQEAPTATCFLQL